MNIQKYILPDWKIYINRTRMPANLKELFLQTGQSISEYLDRRMMRTLPDNWFDRWVRYRFPMKIDPKVVQMHRIIAESFERFINQPKEQRIHQSVITSEEVQEVLKLQEQIEREKQEKLKKKQALKDEIKALRRKSRPERVRPERKKVVKTAPAEKPKPKIDHDMIYKKWMEHVNQKPISKSYWHIHEYLSKYILQYAKTHNPETGELTEKLLEDFLAEYGKNKRPKTMNHYNRVARYFYEFYKQVVNEQS